MSTSGTITYSLNAGELITYALRKINIIGEAEDPSAEAAARAMREMNLMLKGWQKYENLWRLTEGSVALTNATASYTLSPIPHQVLSARYRNASSLDLPMDPLLRSEYYDLPNKSVAGIPTTFYVDYQRSGATLYVWPVQATVTTETIKYTFLRKFEDVSATTNDVDVKQEHLEVVGYNLAARLCDDYASVDPRVSERVIQRAQLLLEESLDDDRPDFIQLVPG